MSWNAVMWLNLMSVFTQLVCFLVHFGKWETGLAITNIVFVGLNSLCAYVAWEFQKRERA